MPHGLSSIGIPSNSPKLPNAPILPRHGMQTYKRNLILTLAFLVAGGLHAASITGRISDLTGIPVTSSTFVRFELKNCASNIPRVLGQSMIVPNVKDVVPNAQGIITGQVIGNDAITCDVLGNTFYHVTVWNGKTKQFDQNYRSEEHTSELQSPCNLVCRLL